MDVEFTTYPIQEWLLNTDSQKLTESEQTLSAIAQDITFALSVERNKYPIMSSNFGVEFEDLLGKDEAYVKANIKRRIQDALLIDDRIISVSNFAFKKVNGDSLFVSFVVETVLGTIETTTNIIS